MLVRSIYVPDFLPVSADVLTADTCTAVADGFANLATPLMVVTLDP